MSQKATKKILWWGRSDPNYSRNRIIRKLLIELGWEIEDFSPKFSPLACIEAMLSRLPKADLVWVPCFRQRDVIQASYWAKKNGIPLIFDPLISAYDKQVWEREKFPPQSRRAQKLLKWEQNLLHKANHVVADTQEHANYFHDVLQVAKHKLTTIPVSAEETLFFPQDLPPNNSLRILFFGSFIRLQGVETIAEAIQRYKGSDVEWLFIGDGPFRTEVESSLSSYKNVTFLDWLPYLDLPSKIAEADICLGIFGSTAKAGRVIPNKVYQSLACGRPVVTRQSPAYPEKLNTSDSGIFFIPEADPDALAETVAKLASQKSLVLQARQQAYNSYQQYFSNAHLKRTLETMLIDVIETYDRA